jgi:hypothetical protein
MHKFYTCFLLLLTGIGLNTYAQISVNFISPAAPYTVDTSVNLELAVTSTYTVSSVKATVSSRQTTLTYTAPHYYGRINVADLPFDTLVLTVRVTDALGNVKDTSINIIHDAPPVLVTDTLLPFAVATPTLRVRASASDNASIDSITLSGEGFSYLFKGNSIDTTINLLSDLVVDGSETFLRITATDNRNQKTTKRFTVYVEESPYLERVYTAPNGKIVDFKNNKVLIGDDSLRNRIVDIQTNVSTEIPIRRQFLPGQAYLTSNGAFFSGRKYDSFGFFVDTLYDWNSGVFKLRQRYGIIVSVAGKSALWYGSGTMYRDFSTASDHLLKQNEDIYEEQVLAKNGLAFYRQVDHYEDGATFYAYYSYYEGQTTLIPSLYWFEYKLYDTDGRDLLFASYPFYTDNIHSRDSLLKTANNGTSRILISTLSGNSESAHPKLNKGYAAFVRYDNSLYINSHIYLWDSTGHQQQKTFWANSDEVSEKIKALDSTGSFVFAEATASLSTPIRGYYYAGIDGSQLKLTDYVAYNVLYGAGEGNDVFIENGQFYITIGNTLFKVNTVAQEVVNSFQVNMKQDSVHSFTREDFSVNYNGVSPVVNVKIVSVPAHGVLTLNGRTIAANNIVVTDSLDLLKYAPAAGYSGADTIVWNASSGGAYAADNALITINIAASDSLPVPQIIGMSTQYCGNAGEVAAKVINPPAGATVVATIDAVNVQFRPDSTVRFYPSSFAGGTHQLKVSYSNAVDTTSTTISFSIIPVSVPDLTLTANITTVNTASDTVIITAQVPVGYKNALYTFAWDPNFSNLIQWESVDNIVSIAPDAFAVGNNTVYAKVRTGNACSSSITATDSIVITRSIVTAVPDTDVPGKMILAYPNPFNGPVTIKGFQVNKQYTLSLFDMQGKLILKKRVYQQSKTEMNVQGKGNYILQINDDTKKRLLGSLQIIRI